MVTQATAEFLVGGSDPGADDTAADRRRRAPARIRTAGQKYAVGLGLPFDCGRMWHKRVSNCLEPSQGNF